jgi:UTP-glucose-1-phosphate uridylyltransferase
MPSFDSSKIITASDILILIDRTMRYQVGQDADYISVTYQHIANHSPTEYRLRNYLNNIVLELVH